MENRGLLFIPDISGFTQFVSETEIEHSRLIIQELLEILIDANQTGLEISEIEGDAILFYKFGDPPNLDVLYKQVENMFCAFHRSLNSYDVRKYCQCTACTSAINLTIKVISHYGEFTSYSVKNFSKLIGKDVIVAHQLLKNNIENHEYWLVTQSLLPEDKPESFAAWMDWQNGNKQTETGEVSFRYTMLSQLKNELPAEPLPQPELSDKIKVLTVSREYDTDIITLFHAAGDFTYRARWLEGVSRVEEVTHFLPRIGMRCRYIMDNGEVIIYTSSYYRYQDDKIEFSESDEFNRKVTSFSLLKMEDRKTKLTVDVYLKQSLAESIIYRLTKKKKVVHAFGKSLENLEEVVSEVNVLTC